METESTDNSSINSASTSTEEPRSSLKPRLLNDDENYEFKFTKTLEPDIKFETPKKDVIQDELERNLINDNTAEKRQKLNDGKVRKRIRKLTLSNETNKDSIKKFIPFYLKIMCVIISVVIAGVAICSEKVRNDLFENYDKKYNLLVHGRVDYCNQHFDYTNITTNLKSKLVGQDSSIDELIDLFEKHEEFTSIGLIGSRGVGKTYTTSLIEETFSWRENINFYIWTDESGNKQIENIQKFEFSNCGHNILFIDDLCYEDRNYIQQINAILKNQIKVNKLKLIIFYIFNLTKHTEMSVSSSKSHAETLKLIKDINIIEYRDLNSDDILNCINLISKSLNLVLTDKQKLEALKHISDSHSGCKNVYAKIFLYANGNN